MTGQPAPQIITPELIRLIGQGYLHNIVRIPHVTCQVCATSTPNLCRPCEGHQFRASSRGALLASQVVPIIYGVDGGQSGHLMYTYKSDRATAHQRSQLLFLGLLAFQQHRGCLQGPAVSYLPISAWSSVPSTSGRTGVHPIDQLGVALGVVGAGDKIELRPGPGAVSAGRREFVPDRWVVAPTEAASGRHVLLVDDTWVSGGRAQSAATALHAAGARAVTVLVVARWMDPTWGDTMSFLKQHARAEYSPYRCPVTGGGCPSWASAP